MWIRFACPVSRPTLTDTFLVDLPQSGFTAQVIVFMMDKCILPPPPGCPPEIYALMAKCWRFNAAKRIGFSKLLKSMAKTIKVAAKADALSGEQALPPIPYKVVKSAQNIAFGCPTQQLALRCMCHFVFCVTSVSERARALYLCCILSAA